jgi:CBS domain containing-hemolysin-like protein
MNHLLLVGTALAICGEAFFSGTEMTLLNTNPAQVYRRARRNDWRAKTLLSYYRAPDYWLATTVLGTNICVVSGAFCAESWAEGGPRWLIPVTGLCNVLAVLLLGEILPKYLLRPVSTSWALAATPVLWVLRYPAMPLGLALRLVTRLLLRPRREGTGGSHYWASREDLTNVLSERLKNTDSVRRLATGVLQRLEKPASDLMTPVALAAALPFPSNRKVWRNCLARGEGQIAKVVDHEGRLLSLARPQDLLAIDPAGPPPNAWPTPPVAVGVKASLAEVLDAMRRRSSDWALLLSGRRPVGYILLEDVPERLMEG